MGGGRELALVKRHTEVESKLHLHLHHTAFVGGMMVVGVNHDLQRCNITMINPGTRISAAIFILVDPSLWYGAKYLK